MTTVYEIALKICSELLINPIKKFIKNVLRNNYYFFCNELNKYNYFKALILTRKYCFLLIGINIKKLSNFVKYVYIYI